MAKLFNINLEDARIIVNSALPHEDWVDRAARWANFGCVWDGDAMDLYYEAIAVIKNASEKKFYAANHWLKNSFESRLFFGTETEAEKFFDNVMEEDYRLCAVRKEDVTQIGVKEVETGKFRRVFGTVFPDNSEGYFVDVNNEV